MAALFGLHPWDIERLTPAQLERFHSFIEQSATGGDE